MEEEGRRAKIGMRGAQRVGKMKNLKEGESDRFLQSKHGHGGWGCCH